MWKRSIRSWIALVAVFGLLAAACGGDDGGGDGGDGGGDGGGGSIWVLLPDSATSPRWEGEDRPALKAALEAADLVEGEDFTIVNAEGDAATQQSQAEQAIADGASAIILASVDTASGATIIETAEAEGIEVIEYDRFNTEGPGGIAYVSFDNVAVGRTMADVLTPEIDAQGGTPAVVMLNGGEEDNNSFLFRQGYAETVEAKVDAGEWTLVADQHVPGWGANGEGQGIMEGILVDADNKVDAVFAANDNLAQQAINALEAAGVGPIPISGQDASIAGMQNILLGLQTMSVYKPIPAEADVAVAIALAVRNGDDPTAIESEFDFDIIGIDAATGEALDSPDAEGAVPYYATVPIGVTADNMMETVVADEFLTIEEICAGDVAETEFCQANA